MIEMSILLASSLYISPLLNRGKINTSGWQPPVVRPAILGRQMMDIGDTNNLLQWEALKDEIDALLLLEKNWDGYGAAVIESDVANNSKRIIDLLQASNWPGSFPEISPIASGTISFTWEQDNVEAYLEVGLTRYAGYIQRNNQRPTMVEGNVDSFNVSVLYPIVYLLDSYKSSTQPISWVQINFPVNELIPA